MSLSLYLLDSEEERIADINWLRNPFGLEPWAEGNTKLSGRMDGADLYFVCNNWAYSKSEEIDRPLFKKVVDKYWEEIQELEQGYFFFSLPAYRNIIQPNYHLLPRERKVFGNGDRIVGEKYVGSELAIPQEHFDKGFDLKSSSLESYKTWFCKLVDFADKLQDETTSFYCSR